MAEKDRFANENAADATKDTVETASEATQNAADAAGDAAEALARGAGRTAGNENNAATDAFDLEDEEF